VIRDELISRLPDDVRQRHHGGAHAARGRTAASKPSAAGKTPRRLAARLTQWWRGLEGAHEWSGGAGDLASWRGPALARAPSVLRRRSRQGSPSRWSPVQSRLCARPSGVAYEIDKTVKAVFDGELGLPRPPVKDLAAAHFRDGGPSRLSRWPARAERSSLSRQRQSTSLIVRLAGCAGDEGAANRRAPGRANNHGPLVQEGMNFWGRSDLSRGED